MQAQDNKKPDEIIQLSKSSIIPLLKEVAVLYTEKERRIRALVERFLKACNNKGLESDNTIVYPHVHQNDVDSCFRGILHYVLSPPLLSDLDQNTSCLIEELFEALLSQMSKRAVNTSYNDGQPNPPYDPRPSLLLEQVMASANIPYNGQENAPIMSDHLKAWLTSEARISRMVQTLLRCGADPTINTTQGNGLTLAIEYGLPEIAKILLKHDWRLAASDGWYNYCGSICGTEEHAAAFAQILKTIFDVLKQNVSSDKLRLTLRTAFNALILEGSYLYTNLLAPPFFCERPSILNEPGDSLGNTFLHQWLSYLHAPSTGVIKQLLRLGADPTIKNRSGQTPLDIAQEEIKHPAFTQERCEELRECAALIEKHLRQKEQTERGDTPPVRPRP